MAKPTQFINVNILDSLTIKGVPVLAGEVENQILINQNSTAASQEPVGLDTPLRVEFGPAAGGPSDPVQIDSTGLITINQADTYRFDVVVNFGRTGAAGISTLLATVAINGVVQPDANPIYALLDSGNIVIPGQFTSFIEFPTAPVTVEYLIARDSAGNDSGGLFGFSPTTLPWPDSPTASIEISRVNYNDTTV